MPTKRTRLARPARLRITPELLRLYALILEIRATGDDARWEHDDPPGRKREMYDCEVALMAGLGLHPWYYVPTDVPADGPPPPWDDPERWEIAQALRQRLDAALRARGMATER
jgi:hypothetical protein